MVRTAKFDIETKALQEAFKWHVGNRASDSRSKTELERKSINDVLQQALRIASYSCFVIFDY